MAPQFSQLPAAPRASGQEDALLERVFIFDFFFFGTAIVFTFEKRANLDLLMLAANPTGSYEQMLRISVELKVFEGVPARVSWFVGC